MGKRSLGVALIIAIFIILGFPKSVIAANACTWTGAAGDGKWSSTSNWDCGTGVTAYPKNGDSAQISFSTPLVPALVVSQDVDISGLTAFTLKNATLTTNKANSNTININTLNLQDGGTVNGDSAISVKTQMNWTGGTLAATGNTSVDNNLAVSGILVLNSTLTVQKQGGGPVATVWSQPPATSGLLTGTGNFVVKEGTFTKSGGGSVLITGIALDNTAEIIVSGGSLEIPISSTTFYGPYTVTSGTLIFNGTHTFDDNDNEDITGAGTVEFKSGSAIFTNKKANAYKVDGGTTISGAVVNMSDNNFNLTSLGSALSLSSGTFNLGAKVQSVSNFTFSGGELLHSGSAPLTVSSALDLSGSMTLTGGVLSSSTACSWSGAGTLSGTGTFNNFGSLTKNSAGTSSITTSTFTNTGAVSASDGILEFSLSAASTGTYAASNTAILRFLNGHTFGSAATITGTELATIEFNAGDTTVNGTYNVTGTTFISGSSAAVIIPPSNLTSLGKTLTVTSGSLDIGSKMTSVETFNLGPTGTLIGTGTLTTGIFNESGGTLGGAGGITMVTGSAALGGSFAIVGHTLTTNAPVVWDAAGSVTGTGTWNHTGTLTKSSPGISTINLVNSGAANFTNSGSVSVTDGELELNLSAASHGPYSVASGKTLRFIGSHDFGNAENENISGAGGVEFKTGTFNFNNNQTGAYIVTGGTTVSGADVNLASANMASIGAALIISSGSLNVGSHNLAVSTFAFFGGNFSGTGTFTSSTLTWSGGAMSGSGSTTITNTTDLSGSLALSGHALETSGTITWNAAGALTGNGSWTNQGTLTKTGGGTTSIALANSGNPTFTNSGTVQVSNGILELNVSSTSTGSYAVAGSQTLRFTGGHDFTSPSNQFISGAGTVEFTTGTINLASGYGGLGETLVTGATVTVNQPASSTGPINVTSGTLKFIGDHNFSAPDSIFASGSSTTVDFVSGTFSIQAPYNVSGTTSINGGIVTINPGALTKLGSALIITSGSLDLRTASPTISAFTLGGTGVLTGSGTLTTSSMTWSGGTLSQFAIDVLASMDLSGALTLNQQLTLSGGGTAAWSGAGTLNGTGTWVNQGSLTKSSAGISTISITKFQQLGNVSVTQGTLSLSLSIDSTGTFSATSPGILQFNGSHDFGIGANLSGNGTLQFINGIFNIYSIYNFDGETQVGDLLKSGTVFLYNTGTSSTGPYSMNLGSLTFVGNHTLGAAAAFTGGGNVTFTSGMSTVNGNYAITGTTTVASGIVNLRSTVNPSGPFVVDGVLNLYETKTFGSNAPISGSGTVGFYSGTVHIGGAYALSSTTGTTLVDGAVADFGQAMIPNMGLTLDIRSGTFDLGTKDLTVPSLALSGTGNLSGTGAVTAANFSWSGGSMGTAGNTIVNSTLNMSGNLVLTGRTLQLNTSGSAIWNVGSSQTHSLSGTGTFINSGTLVKTGSGVLSITVSTFRHLGLIQVPNGQIEISPTTNSTGDYLVSSLGTLRFMSAVSFDPGVLMMGTSGTIDFAAAGTTEINGAYGFTGATTVQHGILLIRSASPTSGPFTTSTADGQVRFFNDRTFPVGADLSGVGTFEFVSGNIVIDSLLNMNLTSGATIVSGSVVNLTNTSNGNAPVFGATLSISSGTLSLGSGKLSSVGTLVLSGGALTGPDSLNAANLTWSGGRMAGAGTTTVSTGLSLGGDLYLDDTRSLLYTNTTNANPNWNGPGTLSGTGTLQNFGKLKKTDPGTFTVSVNQVTHSGAFEVSAGILALQPSGGSIITLSGTFNAASPGEIIFSGSFVFSGAFSGDGSISFNTGDFTVKANYDLSGNTSINGAVSIQYPTPAVHTTGSFTVQAGTLTFVGGHIFDSGAIFSGPGVVEFNTGTYEVNDAYSLKGETRILDRVTINYPAPISSSTGGFTVVSGNLFFTGDHTFDAGTIFSGGGAVEFTSGAFTINGNYGVTGDSRIKGNVSINYPSPSVGSTGMMIVSGVLNLSGGHTFLLGADISGTGTIDFKSGAIEVNSRYEVAGTTTVSGATLSLANANLVALGTQLNLSGGSLYLGFLDASVTNLTWSSGVMGGSGGTTTIPAGGQLQFLGTDPLILSTRTLTNLGTASWNRSSGDGYLFLANGASLVNEAAATFNIQTAGAYVFNGTGNFINQGAFNKNNTDTAVITGISFANQGTGSGKGVNVNGGSLDIGSFSINPSTSTGDYQVATGASLIFSGPGQHYFTATSSFSGAGGIEFRSGKQILDGILAINGSTLVSGADVSITSSATLTNLGSTLTLINGKLTLDNGKPIAVNDVMIQGGELSGSDTITISGHLSWSDGTLSGKGTTYVAGTAELTGNKTLKLDQRRLVVNKDKTAQWNSTAYLYLTNGAVVEISDGATLVVNPTSTYVFYGTGECVNAGTLTLGGGILNLSKFTQTPTGKTNMIVNGTVPGKDFSQIQTGVSLLAGELHVSGALGYVPNTTLIDLVTYITPIAQSFDTLTLASPFDTWETKVLVDRLRLSTPALRTFIPMVTK